MNTKVVIALLGALVVLGLVWTSIGGAGGSPQPGRSGTSSADAEPQERGATALEGEDQPEARVAEPRVESGGRVAISSPSAAPERARSRGTIRGRVVDTEGRVISGAAIFAGPLPSGGKAGVRSLSSAFVGTPEPAFGGTEGASPATEIGKSGERGLFEIPRPDDGSLLHARGERLVPVRALGCWDGDPNQVESVLVVARPAAVAGVVVDVAGRPIEGVVLAVRVPDSPAPASGSILDCAVPLEHYARSDADGRFEIADAPGVAGRLLVVRRVGSPPLSQPLGAGAETQLRIVFDVGAESETSARGIVLDAQGKPVAGASVRFGPHAARTEADGSFVIETVVTHPATEILASKAGFLPGRAVLDLHAGDHEIRLGPPALRLAGRVVDSDGRPIAGVDVQASDLTRIDGIAIEDLAAGEGPGPSTRDETDAEGRFEIGGLDRRAYVLALVDRRSMLTMRTEPIEAGRTDAEIRFGGEGMTVKVAGRVVDRAGQPVPGAEVWLVRETTREERGQGDRVEVFTRANGEGAFEFPGVSADVRYARVAFPNDLSFEHRIEPGQNLGGLVLVAYRRAHIQIDLSGSSLVADGFEVLDGTGEPLSVGKFEANLVMSMSRGPITGERSDVLTSLDSAETVVLYHKDAESGRIKVRLVPGEVTIVRP
ncbi:MAG: hypothetical protein ACKVXR_10350 [Planctomycetota bacterium]